MEYIKNLNPATITTSPRIPGTAGATWDNSRDRLMAEGWRKLIRGQLPEGETESGPREYIQHPELDDSAQEVLTTRPTAEIEAERAAADLQSYGGALIELAECLSAFPGIEPGMSHQQISDIIDGYVAGLDGEQLSRAVAKSLRAENLYQRLAVGGVTGERFWRAMAALGGGA